MSFITIYLVGAAAITLAILAYNNFVGADLTIPRDRMLAAAFAWPIVAPVIAFMGFTVLVVLAYQVIDAACSGRLLR
jgi:hypothetical protein